MAREQMTLSKVAIVGASLAGLRTAQSLRRNGFDGRITLIGEEAHAPYDRPPLSKEVLAGSWEPDDAFLEIPGGLEALELELRLGQRATALDLERRRVLLGDSEAVEFEAVVIATGARPRTLPSQHHPNGGAKLGGVFTLRTLDDCVAIREALQGGPRVAVVGAGFIGSEVAASCRKRGLEVTVIEALPVPLGNVLGPQVGATLAQLHRDHGVQLATGVGVESLEGTDRVSAVRLADGTMIAADVVVIGVGVVPNTEWLSASGLQLDNGVVCDTTCKVQEGVYVAGDAARWANRRFGTSLRVEHWSNAVEQGMYLGRRILTAAGSHVSPFDSVPFFWSDLYETKIQSVGTTLGTEHAHVIHGDLDAGEALVVYERAQTAVGAVAIDCPTFLMRLRPLMGAASVEEVVASLHQTRAKAPT